MKNKDWLSQTLALAGTILVTIPVLFPLVFSIVRFISVGDFLLDYLMPAELGLPVLIGAGLLLWAAIRSKHNLKMIAWSLGLAIILVFGSQALAEITGLATGRIDATGWQYGVAIGGIIGYDLVVITLAITGIMLCRHLFHRGNE
jgi:hypothetical protein